jgi:hypothetical protein
VYKCVNKSSYPIHTPSTVTPQKRDSIYWLAATSLHSYRVGWKGLTKTEESVSQNTRSVDRDLKPGPPYRGVVPAHTKVERSVGHVRLYGAADNRGLSRASERFDIT